MTKSEIMIEFLLAERRVLLIGPDYDQNVELAEKLEDLQHTVDIASSTKEAENLLLCNSYDISLINYFSKSRKDEILKKLNKKNVRSIVFTSNSGVPEGYDGSLPSDFDFGQLKRMIT